MVAHKVTAAATIPFPHIRALRLELPHDMLFMFVFLHSRMFTFDIWHSHRLIPIAISSAILSKTPTIKAWQIEFRCYYQNHRISAVIVCKLNSKWEIDWTMKKRTPFIGESVSNTCLSCQLIVFFFLLLQSPSHLAYEPLRRINFLGILMMVWVLWLLWLTFDT